MWDELGTLVQCVRRSRLRGPALERWRLDRLQKVVRHAWQHVPYYRQLMETAGVRPEHIRSLADLRRLPISERADLQAAGPALLSANARRERCVSWHTSGTSGVPLQVLLSRSEDHLRKQLRFRALLRVGFRPWDRLAALGPAAPAVYRLHERLGLFRRCRIPYRWSVADQRARLHAFQPTFLFAYPSVLRGLLHELKGRLSQVARPRALVTTAEPLDSAVREHLRADGDPEVFDFYMSREVGLIATECRAHAGLHVCMDHVIVECLDGDAPARAGQTGSLVLTCLNQRTMPFLRYRIGDLGSFQAGPCPCGADSPRIGAPQGRLWPMLRFADGTLLSPMPLQALIKPFELVRQFRLSQHTLDELELELVLARPCADTTARLAASVQTFLGTRARLKLLVVPQMQAGGPKFQAFVSHVGEGV